MYISTTFKLSKKVTPKKAIKVTPNFGMQAIITERNTLPLKN